MPYIEAKTNKKLTDAQKAELMSSFGDAIAIIPGKSSRWLMVDIEDERAMCFSDSDAPCAMVEVKIFGSCNSASLEKMTAKVCEIMSEVACVPSERTYVRYDFCDKWGLDGSNF